MAADGSALNGAVIAFDLDGTLVDTAPDLIGSLNEVLAEQQLPAVPLASARHLVGGGARVLLERGFAEAGEVLDPARGAVLFERFIEVYLGRIAQDSRPFDGLEPVLDDLAAAGAKLAEDAGLAATPHAASLRTTVWEAVVNLAEEVDADAIITGTRSLHGVREALANTLSHALLQHSMRPVLAIPSAAPPPAD